MMNRITQYRLQAGLSPADVSRLLKIPSGIVDRWERGELKPPAWVESMLYDRIQRDRRQAFRKKQRTRMAGPNTCRGWRP